MAYVLMCGICENCADSSRVTYVTPIARSAQAAYIAHIPHIICVTVESGVIRYPFAERVFEQSGFGASGLALVQSCGSAGVAPGDGRHQPLPRSQDAPDLDAGSASRSASVHRTPSAPGKGGIWNVEQRMLRPSSPCSDLLARPGRLRRAPTGGGRQSVRVHTVDGRDPRSIRKEQVYFM